MGTSTTDAIVELTFHVTQHGPLVFMTYEPPTDGFNSNIAAVVGWDADRTDELLAAVDDIEHDHHFLVERRLVRERDAGSKGEVIPAQYRVTVTAA